MKKIAILSMIVILFCSLWSCASPEKAIIGSWVERKTVLGVVTETTYTFNEDSSGKITNVVDVNFSYTISDDKLLITTKVLGIEDTEEYSFAFDGDTLTLTGNGETVSLEKVK